MTHRRSLGRSKDIKTKKEIGKMKKFWQDFKKFITRGNVVDMAVGVTVASAFTAIVTAFSKGVITPLIAMVTGGFDLSNWKTVIREEVLDEAGAVVTPAVVFTWGAFLQTVIDFLIIAIVLFVVLRVASGIAARSAKIREEIQKKIHREELERLEAEKRAKEEKEKAEKEEAERLASEAEALRVEKERKKEERLEREEALLREIRDILRSKDN